MICNIIHVRAFLGMQTLKIGLIVVLEGIVYHYIWLKYLFWTVTIYSDILFQHFFKNTKLGIKKKKKKERKTLIFQYFGLVGKMTNKHLFL